MTIHHEKKLFRGSLSEKLKKSLKINQLQYFKTLEDILHKKWILLTVKCFSFWGQVFKFVKLEQKCTVGNPKILVKAYFIEPYTWLIIHVSKK